MEYYLPSEVARLVLGYLKEEECMRSYHLFLKECPHLKEYALMLERGRQYPTSIGGRNLKQIVDDYGKSLDIAGKKDSREALWLQFEALSQQLKKVYKTTQVTTKPSSTKCRQALAKESHQNKPSTLLVSPSTHNLQNKQVLYTPLQLQNVSRTPILQNVGGTPILQNVGGTPILQNVGGTPILQNVGGTIRLIHARPYVPGAGMVAQSFQTSHAPGVACPRMQFSAPVPTTPATPVGRPVPEGTSFVDERPQSSTKCTGSVSARKKRVSDSALNPATKPKPRTRSASETSKNRDNVSIVSSQAQLVTSCGVQSVVTTSTSSLTSLASLSSGTVTNVTSSFSHHAHSSVMSPALVDHAPSPVQSCTEVRKPRKITGTLIEPINPKQTSTPCKSNETSCSRISLGASSSDIRDQSHDRTGDSEPNCSLHLDLSKGSETPQGGHKSITKQRECGESTKGKVKLTSGNDMVFDDHDGGMDFDDDIENHDDEALTHDKSVHFVGSPGPSTSQGTHQNIQQGSDIDEPLPFTSILKTPVKNPNLSFQSAVGKSPRRKSQAPKRRSHDPSTVPSQIKPHSDSSNSIDVAPASTVPDAELPKTLLDELIKNEKLVERLADNINRYKLASGDHGNTSTETNVPMQKADSEVDSEAKTGTTQKLSNDGVNTEVGISSYKQPVNPQKENQRNVAGKSDSNLVETSHEDQKRPSEKGRNSASSEMRKADPSHEIDALLDLGESQMSSDAIKGIIEMTRNDPDFDMLFNMFNMDKTNFIEKEYGVHLKDPSPEKASELDETGHFSMFSPSGNNQNAVSRMSTPECTSLSTPEPTPSSSVSVHESIVNEPVQFTNVPPLLQSKANGSTVKNAAADPIYGMSKDNSCISSTINDNAKPVCQVPSASVVPPGGTSLQTPSVSVPMQQQQVTINTSLSANSTNPNVSVGSTPLVPGPSEAPGRVQNVQILYPGSENSEGHVETIQIITQNTDPYENVKTTTVPNLQGQVITLPDQDQAFDPQIPQDLIDLTNIDLSSSTSNGQSVYTLKNVTSRKLDSRKPCKKGKTKTRQILQESGKTYSNEKNKSSKSAANASARSGASKVGGSYLDGNSSSMDEFKPSITSTTRRQKKTGGGYNENKDWMKNASVVDAQSGIKKPIQEFVAKQTKSSSKEKVILSVVNSQSSANWTRLPGSHNVAPILLVNKPNPLTSKPELSTHTDKPLRKILPGLKSTKKVVSDMPQIQRIDLTLTESRDSTEWDHDLSPSTSVCSVEKDVKSKKSPLKRKGCKTSPAAKTTKPKKSKAKPSTSSQRKVTRSPTRGSRASSRIQKQKEIQVTELTKKSILQLSPLSMPVSLGEIPDDGDTHCSTEFPTIDLDAIRVRDSVSEEESETASIVSTCKVKTTAKSRKQTSKKVPKKTKVLNIPSKKSKREHSDVDASPSKQSGLQGNPEKDSITTCMIDLTRLPESKTSTSKESSKVEGTLSKPKFLGVPTNKFKQTDVTSKPKSLGVPRNKVKQSESDKSKSFAKKQLKTLKPSTCGMQKVSDIQSKAIYPRVLEPHIIETLPTTSSSNLWNTQLLVTASVNSAAPDEKPHSMTVSLASESLPLVDVSSEECDGAQQRASNVSSTITCEESQPVAASNAAITVVTDRRPLVNSFSIHCTNSQETSSHDNNSVDLAKNSNSVANKEVKNLTPVQMLQDPTPEESSMPCISSVPDNFVAPSPVISNMGSPMPAVISNKGSPMPAVISNMGSPMPAVISNMGSPMPASPLVSNLRSPHISYHGSPSTPRHPLTFTLGGGKIGNLTPNKVSESNSVAQTVVVGGVFTPGGSETTSGMEPMDSHYTLTPAGSLMQSNHGNNSVSLTSVDGESQQKPECVKKLSMTGSQVNASESMKSDSFEWNEQQCRNIFDSIQSIHKNPDLQMPNQTVQSTVIATEVRENMPNIDNDNSAINYVGTSASDDETAAAAEALIAMANTPVKEDRVPEFKVLPPGVTFDLSYQGFRNPCSTQDTSEPGQGAVTDVETINNNNDPIKVAMPDVSQERSPRKSVFTTPKKQSTEAFKRNVSPVRSPALKLLLHTAVSPRRQKESGQASVEGKRKRKAGVTERPPSIKKLKKSKKSGEVDPLSSIDLDKFLSKVHPDKR